MNKNLKIITLSKVPAYCNILKPKDLTLTIIKYKIANYLVCKKAVISNLSVRPKKNQWIHSNSMILLRKIKILIN